MVEINIYDLVLQVVNFLILLYVLKRLLYKPLLGFLEKRQNSISSMITDAQKQREEARSLVDEQKEELKRIRKHSHEIVEQAKDNAQKEYEKILNDAQQQAEKVMTDTKKEIEAQVSGIKTALQEEAVGLAVQIAEKVIEKNLDRQENEKFVEKMLKRL